MADMSAMKIPKLSDSNFLVWKRLMRSIMIEKDYWKACMPEFTVESGQTEAAALAAAIAAVPLSLNDKANALLVLNVEAPFMYLIKDEEPAAHNWKRIMDTFASKTTARKVQLMRELNGLRMGDKETISAFFGRAMDLRMQLTMVGEHADDEKLSMHIMAGLPKRFDVAVEVLQDTTKTLPELMARLQLTENRLAQSGGGGGSAYPAHGPSSDGAPRSKWCKYHQSSGHDTSECRTRPGAGGAQPGRQQPGRQHGGQQNGGNGEQRTCHICRQKGHLKKNCPNRPAGSGAGGAAHTAADGGGSGGGGATAYLAHTTLPAPVAMDTGAAAAAFWNPSYDPQDFMLEEDLFRELDDAYGPFTIDGCSSPDGANAHVERFYSKDNDFLAAEVGGETVWLNPPFRLAGKFIRHYLDCKERAPITTSCVMILPEDSTQSWWPLVSHLPVVRRWEANTQLFTMPPTQPGGERRRKDPCHFPVVAIWDPPVLKPGAAPGAAMAGTPAPAPAWGRPDRPIVMDSGATHHMSPERRLFAAYHDGHGDCPSHITVGNNQSLPVVGRGTLQLECVVQGRTSRVELHDVLHVPDLALTLISIPTIADRGGSFSFVNNKCLVSTAGKVTMVAIKPTKKPGEEVNNLYYLHDVAAKLGRS